MTILSPADGGMEACDIVILLVKEREWELVTHGCTKEFGEPKNTSQVLVILLRAQPNVDEIDGACHWHTAVHHP